jgi:hypothetical protein
MEPEDLLSRSQELATGPSSEPLESNPRIHTISLSASLILSSYLLLDLLRLSCGLRFCVHFSLPHACYMATHSVFPDLITLTIFGEE